MAKDGEQFLYLTTIGRRTGQARQIEIWFVEHGGRYYILAEYPERANWVKNIARNSRVQVRVGSRTFEATAGRLDPAADALTLQRAQQLSREKYGWGDGAPIEIVPLA